LAVFRRIIKSGSNPSAAIPETVIIGDRGPSSQAANNPHTTASQAITLFNNPPILRNNDTRSICSHISNA
jgi:hypothetical protein